MNQKLYHSRSRILAALLFTMVAIFAVRLFYIQVIQHSYYVGLADHEQLKKERIPASRGLIYLKNGDQIRPLVMNETVYTVFADPQVIKDKEKIIEVMRQVAGGNLRKDFDKLLDKTDTRYQIIAYKVTRLQADKIKEAGLYGIGFQAVSQRVHPEGGLAAQVLGFVDTEGEGKYGIEDYLNDDLKGVDGRLETVTDVSDVPLTIGDKNIREPAQDGDNVVLSIDRNIQFYVEDALARGLEKTGATNGSVLVMNPKNGKVMAMANLPTYNPAEYSKVQDVSLFNNHAISEPYEPGSDIKTLTLAAGIDKGVVKPTDTFYNTDSIKIGGWTIGNATKGVTGDITYQTALQWSLNTGFVSIAQRLGDGQNINRTARDTLYYYFHDKFRLGQLTGIELSGEAKGILISPDQHEGNAIRYATMSFGQGMSSTMVQVTAGFASMINGGSYYKPTIIDGYLENGQFKPVNVAEPLEKGVVKQSTSDQVRSMMEQAREASFTNIDKPGYNIGGKTGTSQVPTEDGSGYKSNESIGTYLGYGGTDMPEYVIMVSVSGQNREFQGARDAMPIFTDISNWMIDYLRIQPRG